MRGFLESLDFLEVETPMMQTTPGGAIARPFTTHHNALDMPLYLRIAPELNLKRLIVGGFERVYEINRNFRNEGVSTQHNPEFTMMEAYRAYADYNDWMDSTEAMLHGMADAVNGTTVIHYQGEEYDFGKTFERLTVEEAIAKYNPDFDVAKIRDRDYLAAYCEKLGAPVKDSYGAGKLQTEIFDETCEAQLRQPTFITQYPAEVSPLARKNDDDLFVTDRFELFIAGREIANGFSELNDPEDQAGTGSRPRRRRRRGHGLRSRLHQGARVRYAANSRHRRRHRSPRHAVHRLAVDSRRAAVPAHAARSFRLSAAVPAHAARSFRLSSR
jgi:lysyl-tRNA synthetase class 2